MNGHKEIDVVELLGDRIGELLIEAGFIDLDAIHDADDDDLMKIEGIGTASAALIRQKMADKEQENAIEVEELEYETGMVLSGVSEPEATSAPEVKPVEIETETAEGSIAEDSSAVEVVAEEAPAMGPNVAIQNLWPTRLKIVAPSGTEYMWLRAGDVQHVMAGDVEFVMSKNRNVGRACCGANAEKLYFKIF